MSAIAPVAPKTRRKADKSTARQVARPIKTAISLSEEDAQTLGVYLAMTRRGQSEVIAELIRQNLREYVVSHRPRSSGRSLDDQVTQDVSAAA